MAAALDRLERSRRRTRPTSEERVAGRRLRAAPRYSRVALPHCNRCTSPGLAMRGGAQPDAPATWSFACKDRAQRPSVAGPRSRLLSCRIGDLRSGYNRLLPGSDSLPSSPKCPTCNAKSSTCSTSPRLPTPPRRRSPWGRKTGPSSAEHETETFEVPDSL